MPFGSRNRARFRLAIPLLASLFLPACANDPRPDVLLVVVEALRADRMSCYGYARPTTPFMDRLADEGALFEDVTAQFSGSVPAMTSMFTGRYLTDQTETIASDRWTIARAFQSSQVRLLPQRAECCGSRIRKWFQIDCPTAKIHQVR